MPIRTGKQFLESLRDDRRIFIDGELARDVISDRRFAGAAQSLAELYDMQHDPALHDRMTFTSPSSGEKVGLSFIEPRSVDDLIRRRFMIKTWMDANRTDDAWKATVGDMDQVRDRLRTMIEQTDRLCEDPDMDRDRLREMDRLQDRLHVMLNELQEAHDVVTGLAQNE